MTVVFMTLACNDYCYFKRGYWDLEAGKPGKKKDLKVSSRSSAGALIGDIVN